MAGIGFELKKLFSKKGVFSLLRAYGYAGIVCTGPMILGMLLLIGISFIASFFGAASHDRELLNSMITYTLLASMFVTNTFSMVLTRFVADMLYEKKPGAVLPSFWGSTCMMLAAGELLYGIFLLCAGISWLYVGMCFLLFGELVVVWNEMNYLTAIKDYSGIIRIFAAALLIAWGLAFVLSASGIDTIPALFLAVIVAYGVMAVFYYRLMVSYFPAGDRSSACFLPWLDHYPELILLGFFLSLGLFGHLVIMWSGNAGKQIQGLFYGAPVYDIPAILAFLSILITTINFVTSVEVQFYPKYRAYFDALNHGGILKDIRQAGQEMKSVLGRELAYTFMKQFFTTVIFIIIGTFVLPVLPLGINEDMLGIYRVLCIGYAFYAIGNCMLLISLYFSDNKGALASAAVFMAVSCTATWMLKNRSAVGYGVGFWLGAAAFAITAAVVLWKYLDGLIYHVLCSQPVLEEVRQGIFTQLAVRAQQRYRKRWRIVPETAEEQEEHI